MSPPRTLNDVHSLAVSVLRYGRGLVALRPLDEPDQPLELWEFEACPFCRKVREALSELDLPYVSRACAKGSNNRAAVLARGGQRQFPFLVDPNTQRELYESEDIVDYLHETYGGGRRRPRLDKLIAPLNTLTSALASAARPGRGRKVRAGCEDREQPPELLVLYSFEASPYCRKVRERLHELNLDALVINLAKKSPHRPQLVARGGKMQVPYLIDPNTGTELYESDDIVAYLDATYG
ncbi:MAG: glutathione S-transferase [Deltaproteobacteria bacterium HGW-Deltaproteobacteria-14]|jgi:glutathione S-transferase|nr:MAG: glutathione S-transferase [Deltaproteobacteria bacterium HGW-Deltaproteobacteria-14]